MSLNDTFYILCFQGHVNLLCCTSPDSQRTKLRSSTGREVAGSVTTASHRSYLPVYLVERLWSTLNVIARLICLSRKCDHVTPLLRELYCLKAIVYKLAVLACHCSNGPSLSCLPMICSVRLHGYRRSFYHWYVRLLSTFAPFF